MSTSLAITYVQDFDDCVSLIDYSSGDEVVLFKEETTPRGEKPRPDEAGLLDIPPEIREHIFRMLFEDARRFGGMASVVIEVPSPGNWIIKNRELPSGSNIIFTCQSAFHEAIRYLYESIDFLVDISRPGDITEDRMVDYDLADVQIPLPYSFRFDLIRRIDFHAPRNSSSHASLEDAFKRLSWGRDLTHLILRLTTVQREYKWNPWSWQIRDFEPLWEKMRMPYPSIFKRTGHFVDFVSETADFNRSKLPWSSCMTRIADAICLSL